MSDIKTVKITPEEESKREAKKAYQREWQAKHRTTKKAKANGTRSPGERPNGRAKPSIEADLLAENAELRRQLKYWIDRAFA